MSNGMAWEPPPPPRGGLDWAAITAELRANPNEWLRVFEDGPISVVNALRQASVSAVLPIRRDPDEIEGYEVMTRNNKPGPPKTADLYLRWYVPQPKRRRTRKKA